MDREFVGMYLKKWIGKSCKFSTCKEENKKTVDDALRPQLESPHYMRTWSSLEKWELLFIIIAYLFDSMLYLTFLIL